LERLEECESLASRASNSLLDLGEAMESAQEEFQGSLESFLGVPAGQAKPGSPELTALMEHDASLEGLCQAWETFSEGLGKLTAGFAELAAFHDLCGQRLISASETITSVLELLEDILAWAGGAKTGPGYSPKIPKSPTAAKPPKALTGGQAQGPRKKPDGADGPGGYRSGQGGQTGGKAGQLAPGRRDPSLEGPSLSALSQEDADMLIEALDKIKKSLGSTGQSGPESGAPQE
jgi:hypothetical protein